MGCVTSIPKRDLLLCIQTRQEERSPVGSQRIVSIPNRGWVSPVRVEFPHLTSPTTFIRIALLSTDLLDELTKIETLITVKPTGMEIIDPPKRMKYLCAREVLAPKAEQRARLGTQRCIPSPLIIQDRLVRFCSLSVLESALKACLPARASPLKLKKRRHYHV
jgi:hypothetical protein